ncbi:MAG: hypothetical protein SGI92_12895 [Bryobacteraceae bacterium]|nr:hypothetical protein [Bryobacteraceae bacterium]
MTITRVLLGMLPEEAAGDLVEEARTRSSAWLWWQVARSVWWSARGDVVPTLAAASTVLLAVLAMDRFWAWVYSLVPLRDGLGREPWMLAVNVVVAGALCLAGRRRGTGVFMPIAGAAGWWLGLADAGIWYGFPLTGICLIAGRKWR